MKACKRRAYRCHGSNNKTNKTPKRKPQKKLFRFHFVIYEVSLRRVFFLHSSSHLAVSLTLPIFIRGSIVAFIVHPIRLIKTAHSAASMESAFFPFSISAKPFPNSRNLRIDSKFVTHF